MSRRAKLWITAVFSLLISGSAVLLALCWSPENPLRFRVVEMQNGNAVDGGKPEDVMIEVENTTRYPVLLLFAEFGREDMRIMTLGTMRVHRQDPALLDADGVGVELEGGERVQVLVEMNSHWRRDAMQHHARARYDCFSRVEYAFGKLWSKACSILPDRIYDRIPMPESSTDTTPLEPFGKDDGMQ